MVVIAVVAQLAYFNSAFESEEVIFNLWPEIVCAQVAEA